MNDREILIVDDDKMIRTLMKNFFEEKGYKVELAENGEAALDILENKNINLVLSDINMPGIDGFELCKRIKDTYSDNLCIAMTGNIELFETADFEEAGFDRKYLKPIRMNEMNSIVEESFERLEAEVI